MRPVQLCQIMIVLSFFISLSLSAQNNLPQLGKSPVAEVIKAMTLEEKVSLVVGRVYGLPEAGQLSVKRMEGCPVLPVIP